MSPGGHSPVDGAEERSNPTEGNLTVKPAAQGILSGRGPAVPTDFISIQPEPAAAAPAEASQSDLQKPTCPRCGLTVPEQRLLPLSPGLGPQQGSSSSMHRSRRSERRRSWSDEATSSADRCLQLLLACLSCQVSVLLLGLLEACSSCLHALCSSCCHACAHCCSAIQEAPVEELNCHAHCHSVMFESCCEPTECLEFCLECCEICHRS